MSGMYSEYKHRIATLKKTAHEGKTRQAREESMTELADIRRELLGELKRRDMPPGEHVCSYPYLAEVHRFEPCKICGKDWN